MRPKVVAKTMTKELILVTLALTCAIGMPLYYLKLKKIQSEYAIEL